MTTTDGTTDPAGEWPSATPLGDAESLSSEGFDDEFDDDAYVLDDDAYSTAYDTTEGRVFTVGGGDWDSITAPEDGEQERLVAPRSPGNGRHGARGAHRHDLRIPRARVDP